MATIHSNTEELNRMWTVSRAQDNTFVTKSRCTIEVSAAFY